MSEPGWRALLAEAWGAVTGADTPPLEPTVDAVPREELPSGLPVADAAVACVATALLTGSALAGSVMGGRARSVAVSGGQVAAAVRSERYLRVDGKGLGEGFAPLSRFWRAADGWVRTHGNYPWHRRALLTALELDGADPDPERVAAVVRELAAGEVERRVVDAGGVAAAMRTPEQWLAHPAGRAVAARPLVAETRFEPGRPRRREAGPLPASGVRVLDLTRVIAGPVATRYLAALGADVLRLDPPERPELPIHRYDGLPGKRSALLDAATPDGAARLHELLTDADVLVHGYRPGALDRFGLNGAELAHRHPGLVVVALSAWGPDGPWGHRRGFDSIVQVATGIAARESPDGERPGALPCQLLDHGTGYLCAAAALDGLRRQAEHGGGVLRELSLARTAHWLLAQPPAPEPVRPTARADADAWLTTVPADQETITTVAPPGALDGVPLSWPDRPIRYGAAPPRW
ncbi:CoA transferase [Pseudonocardia acaciae]|uniref:CoA transferase n=1 Tax=Pseudonocardia acaciae TaxID=551276 RepID=UPI00056B1CA9|nr:CoA transferase [Pseudonocardia acaciae]